MPLYEYQCTKCHRRTEKIEPVAGPHLKKCPHCGARVERLLAPPAIQFKGTGWYVTDYAAKKTGSSESAPAEKSDTKEGAGKETKETPVKESKDKKAATKKK